MEIDISFSDLIDDISFSELVPDIVRESFAYDIHLSLIEEIVKNIVNNDYYGDEKISCFKENKMKRLLALLIVFAMASAVSAATLGIGWLLYGIGPARAAP